MSLYITVTDVFGAYRNNVLFRKLINILVILAMITSQSLAGMESSAITGASGLEKNRLFGEAENIFPGITGEEAAYFITGDSRATFLRLVYLRSCAVLDANDRGYSVYAM